ncbi:MAG: hypothetical protein DMG22_20610, partial [Acidobacteria bacterium]
YFSPYGLVSETGFVGRLKQASETYNQPEKIQPAYHDDIQPSGQDARATSRKMQPGNHGGFQLEEKL